MNQQDYDARPDACTACAAACNQCAKACLQEPGVKSYASRQPTKAALMRQNRCVSYLSASATAAKGGGGLVTT